MELFITNLSSEYNLDESTVQDKWKNFQEKYNNLNKMKKPELVDICKKENYNFKGSKQDIIKNIINQVKTVEKIKEVKPKSNKINIIEEITKKTPVIIIKKNNYGNHVHVDSGLVFNKDTRKVIGKQSADKILNLTKEDIEVCHKFNFSYEIPENLNDTTKKILNKSENIDDIIDEEELIDDSESDEEIIEYIPE